jgi:hypothetical protein
LTKSEKIPNKIKKAPKNSNQSDSKNRTNKKQNCRFYSASIKMSKKRKATKIVEEVDFLIEAVAITIQYQLKNIYKVDRANSILDKINSLQYYWINDKMIECEQPRREKEHGKINPK